MAVVNTKSTIITNLDATPPTLASPQDLGGRVRIAKATLEVAAADDDGSVFRFTRIHSNASMCSLVYFSDAITAGTVYDFGLYRTAADGGAVADADAYATNVDISSGTAVGVEVAFEARDINAINNRLWQDIASGPSSDPGVDYDICATGDTVGTAAGTISIRCLFTVD